MSKIAGYDDLSAGAGGGGGFGALTASAVVFRFTFSGTPVYVSLSGGFGGWTMNAIGLVPETVVNTTFTNLGAGTRIVMLDATYPLQAAGLAFSANQQALEGQGRGTFIDGDALGNLVHAINLSGYDDCEIKHLSVQTDDTGLLFSHCIFIEDGADRFLVEGITIVNSTVNSDGIHVEGTSIVGGWILRCTILDAGDEGILVDMDAGNTMTDLNIGDCHILRTTGGSAIEIRDTAHSVIYNNVFQTQGIVLYNTVHHVDIVDNIFHDLWFEAVALNGSYYCHVADNVCYNMDGRGMIVTGDHNQFLDNVIDTVGGLGIGLDVNGDANLIDGNYITGCTAEGINITGGTGNRIGYTNYLLGNGLCITDGGTDTMTPWIFIPVPNPDASIGQHQGAQLLDGVDTVVGLEAYVPRIFQQLVTAHAVVLQIDDAASGNMVWTVATDFGTICTQSYNTHEDTAGATTAITQNELECLDVSAAFTALAASDLVGFEFTRDGDHASDTLDAPCLLLGLRLRYV